MKKSSPNYQAAPQNPGVKTLYDRLRFIRDSRAHHQMLELQPGDHVSFVSELGQKITGTIIRLNRKTVSLCTHDGHHWRVSPSLLTKAEPRDVDAVVEPKKPEESKQPEQPLRMVPLTTALFKPHFDHEIARNAPCPCGSGKKYKRCCLQKQATG
jgi:hypothetical protein